VAVRRIAEDHILAKLFTDIFYKAHRYAPKPFLVGAVLKPNIGIHGTTLDPLNYWEGNIFGGANTLLRMTGR